MHAGCGIGRRLRDPTRRDVPTPINEDGPEVSPYEEDYDYYLAGIRVPDWLASIFDVPWRQQLALLLIGFVSGLVAAGLAFLWGLMLAGY